MFDYIAQLTKTSLEFLAEAELRYGPRDSDWHYTGVYTSPFGPQVSFPMSRDGKFDTIRVEIKPDVLDYPNQALFQVAHEVIHLLDPNQSPPTVMMEEGLAVWFSIEVPNFPQQTYRDATISNLETNPAAANYRDAFQLYQELLVLEPDAVRKLRAAGLRLHAAKPSSIRSVLPSMSEELAARLCERRTMRPD